MSTELPLREAIDALFHSLLLGNQSDFDGEPTNLELEQAFARAAELLESRLEDTQGRLFEMRLRLALHLAPQAAIDYSPSNPRPRFRLVQRFLEEALGRHSSLSERLARDVAAVLRAWDEKREAVSGYVDELLRAQAGRCAHCHFSFAEIALVRDRADDFKPYHLAPEELCRPEVDHVEAVSCLGTNEMRNLQALCRLCNAGKGDGLGLDVRDEIAFAGKPISSVDRHHRLRLAYYAILRANRRCAKCGQQNELTIRKIRSDGGLVRTNLNALCYPCLGVTL